MQDQAESSEAMRFAQRLREERVRIEPHQGRFAAKIGLPRAQVSFRETGERDLRADYLERVAEAGLDVCYILTGRRAADALDRFASEIVTAVRALEPAQQHALLAFLATLSPDGTTLHDRALAYQAEPSRTELLEGP